MENKCSKIDSFSVKDDYKAKLNLLNFKLNNLKVYINLRCYNAKKGNFWLN